MRKWKVNRVTSGSQVIPQLVNNRLTGPQVMTLERVGCAS